MGLEKIYKLQPDRTLYLRGFTGFGAAAALHNTSPTGFTVSGVFRDMADFCVLNIYDADNNFEHYSVRYLPDFDLSGLVLTFDVAYRGLQPLDSAKYSWIDWATLDVITEDGVAGRVRLWDHAMQVGGNFSVAAGSCTFSTNDGGCLPGEKITLAVNNVLFTFEAKGGEPAAAVAEFFRDAINKYDRWFTFESNSVCVIASADGNGRLTLKNARVGRALLLGSTVYFMDGARFTGIAAGSIFYLNGQDYSVAKVDSPELLRINVTGLNIASGPYLAEYGGIDGNAVKVAVLLSDNGNQSLTVDTDTVVLSGGRSDDVVWRVTLDFSTTKAIEIGQDNPPKQIAINKLRQAWVTFAPQLANSGLYHDTEWTAAFINWTVTGPEPVRALKCAGPGSVRVGSDESRYCVYAGSGWEIVSANNYQHGYARSTSQAGDSVTLTYDQNIAHDLYLGTSLYKGRAPISIAIDGSAPHALNCNLAVDSELMARRLLAKSLPAGEHTVVITLADSKPFIFDYLEAATPGDFHDAPITYENVSPALDFDTDATYKVSPQRLMWHLQKLGFRGHMNEYLGVFWWNQRKRISGYKGEDNLPVDVVWNQATVTFTGTWSMGDSTVLRIGGFTMRKTVTEFDTVDTIAQHFMNYINAASVSMWAEKSLTGALIVHTRTPNWGDKVIDSGGTNDPRIRIDGSVAVGTEGTWVIDTEAANPINFACRQWHSDLFREVKNAGLQITSGFSMELVHSPDDSTPGEPGKEWHARYADGRAVHTATGFSNLNSSHCAPVPNMTNYQRLAYKTLAALQAEAGLMPWLQFGEFLWWFFSSASQPVGYCAALPPSYSVYIGVEKPHGLNTGDRVVISGVEGCTAANGSWAVTVIDDTHFTVPVAANGDWQLWTGVVHMGSMAFYDSATAAAAQGQLSRPLALFVSQDDDPAVNGGADVAFLQARLKAHVDAIRADVLAAYPEAKFELLFANDVSNRKCYLGKQGGRLNAAINLPLEWMQQEGSGLDRFKVEALSWSADYYNLGLAEEAITFACTAPMKWAREDVAYLVPWFKGGCAWPAEYHLAKEFVPLVNFWAYDHLSLMSWPLPFPTHGRRATFQGYGPSRETTS